MTSQLPKSKGYDPNPFRPDLLPLLAQSDPELFPFLKDLIQILRETHNVNMAGDTTYPWELMTELTDKPLHSPGSIGTFLHPLYGILRARYVKFTQMAAQWQGSPYGWAAAPAGFKWEATNDLSFSAVGRVCGLGASYLLPSSGQYGWVIFDGVNVQSVRYANAAIVTAGQRLQWASSGNVGPGTDWLGTCVSVAGLAPIDATHWDLAPGSVQVSRPQ